LVLFNGALVPLLVGCSNDQVGQVTGTVTVDGKPVEKGSISFFPADGKGSDAGETIENGTYTVKNVPVGAAKVKIRVPKVTGKKKLYDTPESPYRETLSESLPNRYNDKTELSFDVKPGKNEKNFELTTH
jgi:hypothetical protein